MAKYRITAPDGNAYEVTAPDTASQDEVLAYAKANYKGASGGTNYKQVVGSAIKNMFQRPAMAAKDLGTNPQTMANAMPSLLGVAGGASPIPGGATMGTAAGQGIRDLALKGLGKPVPGMIQHGLELGSSVLGDVAALPFAKGKIFGGQIGQAEKAAGAIARGAEKAITPGSVGQTLRDLEAQIDAGTITTAQGAKDAKEIIDQIYMNPKIYEKSPGINVQSARVSQKVQKLINEMVPGRAGPAQAFRKSQTIPNLIGRGVKIIPPRVRAGIGYGTGFGAPVVAIEEIVRRLLGR